MVAVGGSNPGPTPSSPAPTNPVPTDTTAPDTSITSAPATLTNQSATTFAFTSTEPGSTFEISIDGSAFATTTSPHALTNIGNGAHTFSVRARDAAGNTDDSPALHSWTVDLTPPTAAIVFPLPNSYTDANTITVRGTASDANGITSISVNAVAAQSATSFRQWTATVPVSAGSNAIVVSATDAAGNVTVSADAASLTNNGPPFTNLRAMDMDAARDRILAVDERLHALVAIDLTSGATSIVSDRTRGSGPEFDQIEGVVVDGDRALVLADDDIISVDLATGNRTSLPAGGTAETEFGTGGIAVDAENDIAYVVNADSKAVIAVHLATGVRSVVSSDSMGTGPALHRPLDVVFDSHTSPARLIVSDSGVFGSIPPVVLAISISDGNRVALSSFAPTGLGPALQSPSRMRLDAAHNRVLVTESSINRSGILAIDLTDGDRTEIAGPNTGTGREVLLPMPIAVNASGTHAYFAGNPGAEVIALDLQSLDRNVLSTANIGSGASAISVGGLALNGSSLLFLDSHRATLNSVDLNTGARALVSGGATGWGLVMSNPVDLVLDASANLTYVIDAGTYSLLSIDLADGGRRHISGVGVGNGPLLQFPRSITIDGSRALVTDRVQAAVLSVDLSTGDRNAFSSSGVGTGPAFDIPTSIAIDRSTPAPVRAFVVNINSATPGIFSVDLTNGNRALFSTSSPIGAGPSFLLPGDFVFDASGLRLLALDIQHKNLMSVSLANGNRQILSGGNSANQTVIGVGPRLSFPGSLAYDSATGIAYMSDADTHAILAIDLSSGDRVIVSR